jgi:superfamily II DNA helicase RecQ
MRQVKFFKVRLGPSVLKADEAWLNDFLANVKLRKTAPALVQTAREVFWSVYVEFDAEPERSADKGRPLPKTEAEPALSVERMRLYDALREWRTKKAAELSLPSFAILHNKHLRAIALAAPTSLRDLAAIPGIGQNKANRFGRDILAVVEQGTSEATQSER